MSVSIDISQVRALATSLASAGPRVGAKASAALRKTAFDIEADTVAGWIAMDAVDTGSLIGSVSTTLTGDGRHGAMSAEIGPTVEHGIYVELGTSVMPGRPALSNAFDRRAPGLEQALAQLGGEAVLE